MYDKFDYAGSFIVANQNEDYYGQIAYWSHLVPREFYSSLDDGTR